MRRVSSFALLTDENIHPQVLHWLRAQGYDVQDVRERGLIGVPDIQLLLLAYTESRVIITHDSDFGQLAIAQGAPYIGIIYLRPGHIAPDFTISMLETLFAQPIEVKPPFIIVARRHGDRVRIRIKPNSGTIPSL